MARATTQRFKQLNKATSYRVTAATRSFGWDRCATGRRFQKKHRCMICNKRGTKDEPEHLPYCSALRLFATKSLRLNVKKYGNLQGWTLTSSNISEEDDLMKLGLLIYAACRCHNYQRNTASKLSGEQLQRGLSQWLKEAARDTPKIQRMLNGVWQTGSDKKRPLETKTNNSYKRLRME